MYCYICNRCVIILCNNDKIVDLIWEDKKFVTEGFLWRYCQPRIKIVDGITPLHLGLSKERKIWETKFVEECLLWKIRCFEKGNQFPFCGKNLQGRWRSIKMVFCYIDSHHTSQTFFKKFLRTMYKGFEILRYRCCTCDIVFAHFVRNFGTTSFCLHDVMKTVEKSSPANVCLFLVWSIYETDAIEGLDVWQSLWTMDGQSKDDVQYKAKV